MSRTSAIPDVSKAQPGARYALSMLCVLATMSYVDRVVISLFAEPIKRDIGLTDIQIGTLSGLAFVLLFITVSLPLARYADIGNRRLLVSVGAGLWGLMTFCSGFAHTFGLLLICRLGVGLGEAVLVPTTLSIIADLYPPERRAGPTSLFFGASIVGGAMAPAAGASALAAAEHLISEFPAILGRFFDWQLAFMMVGAPALLVAILFGATVQDPIRIASPHVDAPPSVREAVNYFGRHRRLYIGLFVGIALVQVMLFGMSLWSGPFLIRTRGMTAPQAGFLIAATVGIGAMIGSFLTPYIAGRSLTKGPADRLIWLAILLSVLSLAFMVPFFTIRSTAWALAAGFFTMLFLSGIYTLPMIAAAQLSPPRLRAQLVALYITCGNVVGAAAGGFLIPWLAGYFEGPAAIGRGNILAGAAVLPFSIAALLIAKPHFIRELLAVRGRTVGRRPSPNPPHKSPARYSTEVEALNYKYRSDTQN